VSAPRYRSSCVTHSPKGTSSLLTCSRTAPWIDGSSSTVFRKNTADGTGARAGGAISADGGGSEKNVPWNFNFCG
jgi:hypothetical protein